MSHSGPFPSTYDTRSGFTGSTNATGIPHAQAHATVTYGQGQAGSLPRTAAGHKRKLDALRGPQPGTSKGSGIQTAPPVPSFGAPILPTVPSLPAKPSIQVAQKPQKPPGKALGLVPRLTDDAQESSDSEDDKDLDEEAMYAELGDKLTFEHNGVVMSLKSQADLTAWKKERQKNWPTNARMAERFQERIRIGEERRRLLAGAEVLNPASRRRPKERKTAPLTSRTEAQDRSMEPQAQLQQNDAVLREERLAELRRKVAESAAKNREGKAKLLSEELAEVEHTTVDNAENDETVQLPTGTPDVQSGADIHDVSVDNAVDHDLKGEAAELREEDVTGTSSDTSSSISSDSDSDDSAPEEETSKAVAPSSQTREIPLCTYFSASGYCRDGEACRYRHEQPSREKMNDSRYQDHRKKAQKEPQGEESIEGGGQGVRKTIFQRLMEQEQEEEDKLALRVIKHLGKAGLFEIEDEF